MNLTRLVNDDDILHKFRMLLTAGPEQPCFQCEKPLGSHNHYHITITGAASFQIGIQLCIPCYQVLRSEAFQRRAHNIDRPHMAPLTKAERTIPAPIKLESRFAPKAPPPEPSTDLFQEDPNAI